MPYLRITNSNPNGRGLERELLELIGATDKDYDDPDMIGFKGSGLKFAVIAAMRLGLKVIITSCDHNGLYTASYHTYTTELGFQRIFINYNAGQKIIETNFCTNALKDWVRPIGDDPLMTFKIIREIITNAHDADKDQKLTCVKVVSNPRPHETSVYISWHDEFETMFRYPQRYFKFILLRDLQEKLDPLAIIPSDLIKSGKTTTMFYQPVQDDYVRLFLQGVLIHCGKIAHVFDYDFNDKNILSEERTIKNWNIVNQQLSCAYAHLDDVGCITKLLPSLVQAPSTEHCFEVKTIMASTIPWDRLDIDTKVWQKVWQTLYDKHTVIIDPIVYQAHEVMADLESMGYTILSLPKRIYEFLTACGIPTAWQAYRTRRERKPVSINLLTRSQTEMIKKALTIFRNTYPLSKPMPPLSFFKQEAKDILLGETDLDPEHPEIAINIGILNDLHKTLATIIHEYRHHATGLRDYDRAFINDADDIQAQLLIELDALKKTAS